MISDTTVFTTNFSPPVTERGDHLLEMFLWSHHTTPHHTTPHHTMVWQHHTTPPVCGQPRTTELMTLCLCLAGPRAALVSNMINCPRKIFSLSVNNRNELLMYFYGLLWKLGDIKHTHIVILRLQCWGEEEAGDHKCNINSHHIWSNSIPQDRTLS